MQAVSRGSLLDCSLITIARDFDNETAKFLSANCDFPLHLKERLLSYVAALKIEGIASSELRTLFTNENASPDLITDSIGVKISFDDLTTSFAFPFLTHLCLAHRRPEGLLWPSFLAFAEMVPNDTHLCMAYWPLSEVKNANFDDSLQSFRRLSHILTKLQYLDLEGSNIELIAPIYGTDCGPDWTGGWMHVHSLNLSQGPMPVEVSIEGGPETQAWIRGEVLAKHVEDSINHIRKKHGKPDTRTLQVEHGWSVDNFMIKFLIDKAYDRCQPVWFPSID